MNSLIRAACKTLESTEASAALRHVALATLSTAINQGVAVPSKVPRLIWDTVRLLDDVPALLRFTEVATHGEASLVRDILRVLRDLNSGEQIRDLAVFSFLHRSEALSYVTGFDLLAILDVVLTHGDANRLVDLAGVRHRALALDCQTLLTIRDRLHRARDSGIRRAAVEADQLLPEFDRDFVTTVCSDNDADVRVAAAHQYDWTSPLVDPSWALALVTDLLSAERHP